MDLDFVISSIDFKSEIKKNRQRTSRKLMAYVLEVIL
jgi:hypothetical protein